MRTTVLLTSMAATLFIFLIPFPVIGSSSAEKLDKEMHEAWEAFKAYVTDEKHKAIAHGRDLLTKTDAKIIELEGKADKASGETKARYRKEIEELKEKRANAGKKLDELEDASADSWESTRSFSN